jgi:hypothetical protein
LTVGTQNKTAAGVFVPAAASHSRKMPHNQGQGCGAQRLNESG